MISGIFHAGSGLGDQLFRYITTRTIADELGFDSGMINCDAFKGKSFMKLPLKEFTEKAGGLPLFEEKSTVENGIDIRSYDPEINFIKDFTVIDGSFEDEKYWGHNLHNINRWLSVEPLNVDEDLCIIGFRGGEYYTDPNLGLPNEYYDEAIEIMKQKYPGIRFEVHTDDPIKAREFFPIYPIVENTQISHSQHSNMGFNWRSTRFAKYAIIPNSAFFILPRLLQHQENKEAATIAPRYWARRNTGTWARPACFYKAFKYI